jgi:dolichol kinase
MFIACIIVGLLLFIEEPLAEYPVILGAVIATVVELFEPFAVNDNLSIPVFTGLALHIGFRRMKAYCEMGGGVSSV